MLLKDILPLSWNLLSQLVGNHNAILSFFHIHPIYRVEEVLKALTCTFFNSLLDVWQVFFQTFKLYSKGKIVPVILLGSKNSI